MSRHILGHLEGKLKHEFDKKGRLLGSHQLVDLAGEKEHHHETVIIPNDGVASFGSYFTITMREHNCILKSLQLQFNVSAISGLTGTVTNYPQFNPAWYFFIRIELVMAGVVVDTIYGNQQFLMNQLFKTDEERALANYAAGNYSTLAGSSRNTLATSTSNYFVDLFTLFNQNNIPLLFNHTELQLRIYTDSVSNITQQSTLTGTPIATMNYCNLLAKVVRLRGEHPNKLMKQHEMKPHSYKFTDLKYQTNTITSGTTSTNIILSGLLGKAGAILFTIRTSSPTGANEYEYVPLSYFAILDATSTNISGGQNVLSQYDLLVLAKGWSMSSFTTETAQGITNNYAYAYIYSFAGDLQETIENSNHTGSHQFVGNEQLQIAFSSATTSTYQIDIYALTHSVLEISHKGLRKIDDM